MIRLDAPSLAVTKLPNLGRCAEMWQATIKGSEDEWYMTPTFGGMYVRVRHTRLREFCASGGTREDALCELAALVSKLGAVA